MCNFEQNDSTPWEEMIKPFIQETNEQYIKAMKKANIFTANVTHLNEIGIYSCDYCGAYADTPEKINHHSTCTRNRGGGITNEFFNTM